jgi:hypothetical protein
MEQNIEMMQMRMSNDSARGPADEEDRQYKHLH